MIFLDVETCGKYGMATLVQYAKDDGEIEMFSPWTEPVIHTLAIVQEFCEHEEGVCGFNLAFDWFHICKLYTTFKLFADRFGYDEYPVDHIDKIAVLEKEARDGPCLKPQKALDLMLHARKGPYQSLMNRDDIRVRRVPNALAYPLAKELGARIPLKDVYFARNKKGRPERWQVYDIVNEEGEVNPDLKDVVCKFAPSSALKALAVDALGLDASNVIKFSDIEPDVFPEELGYAPFALAMGKPGNWNLAWPEIIDSHITHWTYNERAREYAKNDIVYTRGLYTYFGKPESNDDDSVLACQVAACRWRGFKVDLSGLQELKDKAAKIIDTAPRAPEVAKRYLLAVMDETEAMVLNGGTGKEILLDIVTWENGKHPAAIRAKEILTARRAKKEIELYDKLILAERFHASFTIIGTKSSRMSGTDGLNPQGINHTAEVRSKFPLAWEDLVLCGGDFSSFEVSLAAAVYDDPLLNEDLDQGKKMAGLFGQMFFPDLSYDEILQSEGTEDDMYDRSKRGMYAFFYGGNENTLEDRVQVDLDRAKEAIVALESRYKGIGKARSRIAGMFCAMQQPDGIGTKVVWREPKEYIESPLGFRRYFTLENKICKVLFELSNKPPESWKHIKVKVIRRDRLQTAQGATQSALYGAAFQIQAANFRAAANHEIQCFGSQITKAVQVTVWNFQPCGINVWWVMPFNCHDEIEAPCKQEIKHKIKEAVQLKISSYKNIVPRIKMNWMLDSKSWKGKA